MLLRSRPMRAEFDYFNRWTEMQRLSPSPVTGAVSGQQRLVPGGQHRRHHSGRRLGGRGDRTGGPVGLAAGHPADAAEGTTTPRRATDVHRPRRAPGHRVHHRHRPPLKSGEYSTAELRRLVRRRTVHRVPGDRARYRPATSPTITRRPNPLTGDIRLPGRETTGPDPTTSLWQVGVPQGYPSCGTSPTSTNGRWPVSLRGSASEISVRRRQWPYDRLDRPRR
jgi:hypothetical protein